MIILKNHNFVVCEQSLGLDIKQPPNAQDMFRLIWGWLGVWVFYVMHVYTQMARLI